MDKDPKDNFFTEDLMERARRLWPLKSKEELKKAQDVFAKDWKKQQKDVPSEKYTKLYRHLPYLFEWPHRKDS